MRIAPFLVELVHLFLPFANVDSAITASANGSYTSSPDGGVVLPSTTAESTLTHTVPSGTVTLQVQNDALFTYTTVIGPHSLLSTTRSAFTTTELGIHNSKSFIYVVGPTTLITTISGNGQVADLNSLFYTSLDTTRTSDTSLTLPSHTVETTFTYTVESGTAALEVHNDALTTSTVTYHAMPSIGLEATTYTQVALVDSPIGFSVTGPTTFVTTISGNGYAANGGFGGGGRVLIGNNDNMTKTHCSVRTNVTNSGRAVTYATWATSPGWRYTVTPIYPPHATVPPGSSVQTFTVTATTVLSTITTTLQPHPLGEPNADEAPLGLACNGQCGYCGIYFPTVNVYYWPQASVNTACLNNNDSNAATSQAIPASSGFAAQPRALSGDAFLATIDGFTFTSPSAYIAIPQISAANSCNQVGSVHYSTTLAVGFGKLSTLVNNTPYPFDFADALCPPASVSEVDHISFIGQGYRPIISPPPEITDIDPAWKTFCYIDGFQGNDPPIALQQVPNLIATTTSPLTNQKPTPASPVSTGQALPAKTTSSAPIQTDSSSLPDSDPGNSAGSSKSSHPAATGGSSQLSDANSRVSAAQSSNSGQDLNPNQASNPNQDTNSSPASDANPNPNRPFTSPSTDSEPLLHTTHVTLALSGINAVDSPTTSLSISTLVYQDPSDPAPSLPDQSHQNIPSTQKTAAPGTTTTSTDAASHLHTAIETASEAGTQSSKLQTAHVVQVTTNTDAYGSHTTQLSTFDFVYQASISSTVSSERCTSQGLGAIILGALGFSTTQPRSTGSTATSGPRSVSTSTTSSSTNGQTGVALFTGGGGRCNTFQVWGMGLVVGISVVGVAWV